MLIKRFDIDWKMKDLLLSFSATWINKQLCRWMKQGCLKETGNSYCYSHQHKKRLLLKNVNNLMGTKIGITEDSTKSRLRYFHYAWEKFDRKHVFMVLSSSRMVLKCVRLVISIQWTNWLINRTFNYLQDAVM